MRHPSAERDEPGQGARLRLPRPAGLEETKGIWTGRQWPPRDVASRSFSAARAGEPAAKDALEIWTYRQLRCLVDELVSRDADARPCDADAIFSIALRRAEAGRDTVRDPAAYASWVSVVGRNAFLNYRRAQPRLRMVKEVDLTYDADASMESAIDGDRVRTSVRNAIDRLPAFLRIVATMRLIEDRSYDAISAATGKPKPTVRSYVNKAVERLRTDELLRTVLRERR